MTEGHDGLMYRNETALSVEVAHWQCGQLNQVTVSGPHQVRLVRPAHTLIIYDNYRNPEGGNTLEGVVWFDQKRIPCKLVIGQMAVMIPCGCDFEARTSIDGTLSYTVVSMTPALFEALPGGGAGLSIEPDINIRPPLSKQLCTRLKTSSDELHATSLMLALLTETTQHHSGLQSAVRPRERFSDKQRHQLISYIEDNLSEAISLSALAGLTNLSVYHFSRVFKHHFGISPYQYVLQQRLEHARQLLMNNRALTLSDIASRCGFGSPSQFSTHFRRYFGLPPSYLRL